MPAAALIYHTPFNKQIHECSGFNSAGYLKAFPRNESVDSYIAKSNCGMNATADITEVGVDRTKSTDDTST